MIRTSIDSNELAEAAKAVADVATKDTLSQFSRIRLDVAGPAVSLTASDGAVQVEWRIEGRTSESGTVTVPGRLFKCFCGAVSSGCHVDVVTKGKKLHLGAQGASFAVDTWDAAEFPQMARPKEDAAEVTVDAMALAELLRKTSFAASQNETRPNLKGVNVKFGDGKLEMTATDGRRLAHVEYEDKDMREGRFDITLTNKTVGLLRALLAKESEYVRVIADSETAVFEGDAWHLTTRVIDAVYPNWSAVVPANITHWATVGRRALAERLSRVALSADMCDAVEITIKAGLMELKAQNDISKSSEMLPIVDGGRPPAAQDAEEKPAETPAVQTNLKRFFNWRLLKEALEVVDDVEVRIEWNDRDRAAVVLRCSAPWLCVVMPLWLK